ncbi:MAG: M1 family metallopeptidase [Acidobacteriota bacterium]
MRRSSGTNRQPPALLGALLVLLCLLPSCRSRSGGGEPDGGNMTGTDQRADIHSYAQPAVARVRHMAIDWTIDFDRRVLDGRVTLTVEKARPGPVSLLLDTRDLDIVSVKAGPDETSALSEVDWLLGKRDPHLGSPLQIQMPAGDDLVEVAYRTRPSATGLQWLTPRQTYGGRHPFLYSQAQAIHARSFLPCQDSPSIRVTFAATLHVPRPLTAVMAAARVTDTGRAAGENTVTSWQMQNPIPTYLIAFAAGDLGFAEIGPRTGVWAEPGLLDRAAGEFADMERMLEAGESIYGPYRWGRYEVLVLPPSFPFGGMENPTLTFATPTVLAGDRSLVSLVAHELAHSWSGNLVTNATWSDFWLNEGFTTYFERRIMEAVYGRERAEMEWMLGRRALDDELERFADAPGDQVLDIDLTGRDPDDGMTDIPYEKGSLLLRLLEQAYGRPRFDAFLRSWFDGHAFTSVKTDVFEAFLKKNLLAAPLVAGGRRPDIETWIHRPGLPADAPRAVSGALEKVDRAVDQLLAGTTSAADLDTSGWVTQQWLHFLQSLPDDLSAKTMASYDAAFAFTRTGNAEILDVWLELAIRHDYAPAFDRLESFLTGQGRRKFLTPLYRALMTTAAGQARAREIYARARPLYHAISRRTVDEIVGWE